MKDNRGRKITTKSVIKDKMRVLSDFGICDPDDQRMIAKLEAAIAEKPNKDPREVLDHCCRPMIQARVMSWV